MIIACTSATGPPARTEELHGLVSESPPITGFQGSANFAPLGGQPPSFGGRIRHHRNSSFFPSFCSAAQLMTSFASLPYVRNPLFMFQVFAPSRTSRASDFLANF